MQDTHSCWPRATCRAAGTTVVTPWRWIAEDAVYLDMEELAANGRAVRHARAACARVGFLSNGSLSRQRLESPAPADLPTEGAAIVAALTDGKRNNHLPPWVSIGRNDRRDLPRVREHQAQPRKNAHAWIPSLDEKASRYFLSAFSSPDPAHPQRVVCPVTSHTRTP